MKDWESPVITRQWDKTRGEAAVHGWLWVAFLYFWFMLR